MSDVLTRPARGPDAVLRYAAVETGVADVYRATGAAAPDRPVIVLVHGGFWRNRYDRTHLRPMAASLADDGSTVVLPEYRRIGDAGGQWPGGLDDLLALLGQLPDLLGEGGAARPVVLGGHSAGGHLALLAARALSSPLAGVVALAAVSDVAAARKAGLSDHVVDDLLGGPRAPLPVDADPAQLPSPPHPTVLVHGERDDVVPPDYSRRYAAERTSVRLLEIPGADHFDLIDPQSHAGTVVADLLLARPTRSR
ncbi:hypothetical protein GCM10022199_24580 [Marihabitans asiaticum]|uniref:alpha/beta hydrolase n=1 Tax=Marihabitans asiaticum TaxID=415218 RepID=UPI0011A89091|nr:alpha/beta hydrolase [Marihabitans asiaticum]